MRQFAARGVHGQTVEVLAQRILTGQLPEGDTLDLIALQSEFDVSLTVLREALRVLKAKGLVDARPKRGTFVQARAQWLLLDPDVVRWQFAGRDDDRFLGDHAEVRGIIEPAAARLAALRRTDDDLGALQAAIELMAAAASGDGDPVEADVAFHRALLAATHNELLVRTEVVLETGLAARDRLVHGALQDDDPTPAHAAVLRAVRARDPEAAGAAVSALLAKSLLDVEKAQS
jgi:DNA-binding FadR family transcriptional regulator